MGAGTPWLESVLIRAAELAELSADVHGDEAQRLQRAVSEHLENARQAVARDSQRSRWKRLTSRLQDAGVLRAAAHLDAAEADLLRLAPVGYLRGQLPSLLAHIQREFAADDPRRIAVESIVRGAEAGHLGPVERDTLLAAVHAASSSRRRQLMRVRSFRTTLLVTAATLTTLAIALAIMGAAAPDAVALCFATATDLHCPGSTAALSTNKDLIDNAIQRHAGSWDVLLVEFMGLAGAALSGVTTLRGTRGTSLPYSLPVALALLKLPTGALTAVLGLVLLRGEVVPGFHPIGSSAEILAWAIVLGFAQQLFTRAVDRRTQSVLEGAEGGTDRVRTDSVSVAAEVSRTVTESLEAVFAEPRLVDYAGRVEAWIQRGATPVPFDGHDLQLSDIGDTSSSLRLALL